MRIMKHPLAVVLVLVCANPAVAQYEGGIEIPENVLEAIREFSERQSEDTDDVVVVLTPPGTEDETEEIAADGEARDEADKGVTVVPAEGRADASFPGEPSPHGPEVRVQPLREIRGTKIRAADVQIDAPFAAKPIGRPSEGWKLTVSSEVSAFTKNVEVSPGTWLTLAIRPHVLVPEADGQQVYQIHEPGFDAAHGYRQKATISASIASSLRQLEDDSVLLGRAIDDLEQILISLPRSGNSNPTDAGNRR
jgi:hypothetical protein